MASKGLKRPSADPVLVQCQSVAKALKTAEAAPKGVGDMLGAMVEYSFAVVKAERHGYQAAVVDMAGDILASTESVLKQSIEAAQAKLDGAVADKVAREKALAEAEKRLSELAATVSTAKAAVDVDAASLKEAKSKLGESAREQERGDASFKDAKCKMESLELTFKDVFEPLEVTAGTVSKLNILKKTGMELGFDTTLLATLQITLKKWPDARTVFDNVVVKQFKDALTEAISKQAKILTDGEPGVAERANAVVELQKAVDDASEKLSTSQVRNSSRRMAGDEAALAEARKAEAEGKVAAKEASKAVAAFFPDMKKVSDAKEDTMRQLEAFREGPLHAFQQLKDLEPPAIEQEEEEQAGDDAAAKHAAPTEVEPAKDPAVPMDAVPAKEMAPADEPMPAADTAVAPTASLDAA